MEGLSWPSSQSRSLLGLWFTRSCFMLGTSLLKGFSAATVSAVVESAFGLCSPQLHMDLLQPLWSLYVSCHVLLTLSVSSKQYLSPLRNSPSIYQVHETFYPCWKTGTFTKFRACLLHAPFDRCRFALSAPSEDMRGLHLVLSRAHVGPWTCWSPCSWLHGFVCFPDRASGAF